MKLKARLDAIQYARRRKPVIISAALFLLLLISTGLLFFMSEFDTPQFLYTVKQNQEKRANLSISVSMKANPPNIVSSEPLKNPNNDQESTISDFEANHMKVDDEKQQSLQGNYYPNTTNVLSSDSVITEDIKTQNNELYLLPLKAFLFPMECESGIKNLYLQFRDSVYQIKKKKKSFNEIGFIYALNNTLILNNHTRLSFQETSLIEGIPAITSNYGLIFNHQMNGNSVLSLEYLFTSKESQVLNIFKNGKQYQKNLEIDYTRLSVLYQRNFYPGKPLFFSNYYVKAGCYFAYLKNIVHFYDNGNNTISNTVNNYSTNDYGLKLSFGVEKSFERVIMGLGLVTEYGLKNIFIGDNITPASFDRTSNFNNGLNFSIRYKFY